MRVLDLSLMRSRWYLIYAGVQNSHAYFAKLSLGVHMTFIWTLALIWALDPVWVWALALAPTYSEQATRWLLWNLQKDYPSWCTYHSSLWNKLRCAPEPVLASLQSLKCLHLPLFCLFLLGKYVISVVYLLETKFTGGIFVHFMRLSEGDILAGSGRRQLAITQPRRSPTRSTWSIFPLGPQIKMHLFRSHIRRHWWCIAFLPPQEDKTNWGGQLASTFRIVFAKNILLGLLVCQVHTVDIFAITLVAWSPHEFIYWFSHLDLKLRCTSSILTLDVADNVLRFCRHRGTKRIQEASCLPCSASRLPEISNLSS